MRLGQARIGVSGWTYPPWRGAFYPPGLAHRRELAHAAARLTSIEINGTFYGMQHPDSFAHWHDDTPDDFLFAVKGPRYITHFLRGRQAETPVANFLASGVLRLGAKLGPLLWQFPALHRFDPDNVADFLALLPHDTEAAAAMAARHDERLAGRAWTRTDAPRALRHAIEVRHASFAVPAFTELAARAGVAVVWSDAPAWPHFDILTADFGYARLHGNETLYQSRYTDAEIAAWAARVAAWRRGPPARDAFVYFDNTDKREAPLDAQRLIAAVAGQEDAV